MKRDMDLIRQILTEVEKRNYGDDAALEIPGHDRAEISYHVMLLDEAGLMKATDLSSRSDPCWFPDRLTWLGHEFLDAARDDTIWQEARRSSVSRLASVSFSVLQQLLTQLALQALGVK